MEASLFRRRLMMLRYIVIFVLMFIAGGSAKSQVEIINAGVGGNNSAQLLSRLDKDVIAARPDLVIVMVGTNDMLNENKMLSYETYKSNLQQIVKDIKKTGCQVLLVSSPPADSAYLFTRHDRTLFKQTPNEKLETVRNIEKSLAKEQDVLFFDLYQEFIELGLPKHNSDLLFRNQKNCGVKDGVHPTALGYHFIAENVFQFLKQNDLLNKYNKIICLGDSITAGSGSKGVGTVMGENYPSFLNYRLNDYDIK